MKLKKLLPLASIAGVAAVVAPLVTSCGTKTYSYTFDSAHKPEDFIKQMAQITAVDAKELSELDSTKNFLDAIDADKKILFDELTYASLANIAYLWDEEDIKTGVSTAKIEKIDSKTGECSFSFTFDIEFEKSKESDNSAGKIDAANRDVHIDMSVKNLDFVVLYNPYMPLSDINYWCFEPTACAIWNSLYRSESVQNSIWLKIYTENVQYYLNQGWSQEDAEAQAQIDANDSYMDETSEYASQFSRFYLRSHENWEVIMKITSPSEYLPYSIDLVFNSKSRDTLLEIFTDSYDNGGYMWQMCLDALYYYRNVPVVK